MIKDECYIAAYTCDVCGEKFSERSKLMVHLGHHSSGTYMNNNTYCYTSIAKVTMSIVISATIYSIASSFGPHIIAVVFTFDCIISTN